MIINNKNLSCKELKKVKKYLHSNFKSCIFALKIYNMRKILFLRTIILIIVVIGISFPIFAQDGDTLYINRCAENGKIKFARFEANLNSDRKMSNDLNFLNSSLQTKEGDEFLLINESIDELGIVHKKFQQYYRGIKIENAQYLLHGKNGYIDVMNGDFQVVDIPTINPALNEQQALAKALEYVGAERYSWEDYGVYFLKIILSNGNVENVKIVKL